MQGGPLLSSVRVVRGLFSVSVIGVVMVVGLGAMANMGMGMAVYGAIGMDMDMRMLQIPIAGRRLGSGVGAAAFLTHGSTP